MENYSSSIDTLKDNLLRAIDAEYNVIKADIVLDIICQLEKMKITKEQLQTTRLGREINTIRKKIDKKNKTEKSSQLFIEIAQRAKKLLRSWQGLLNTSKTDSLSINDNNNNKPRLILKVKFNSSMSKRKHNSDLHINKRKKTEIIQTSIPISSPIKLNETNNLLPCLKTTQQLLLEMQMNESIQTSNFNTILQNSITSPNISSGSKLFLQYPSSTIKNWENDNTISSLLSSSSITSETSWSLSTNIPESSSSSIPINLKNDKEQLTINSSDLASICASYNTVADLVEDHRRRIIAEYDSRELEARPDLLLVPIDQLAFVYEREKEQKLNITTSESKYSSNFIALPFIDCPMEFDLVLDELIIQYPTVDA